MKAAKPTVGAKKAGGPAGDHNALTAGTVTLTQDQLNSILETIGRLTISNQELSESRKCAFLRAFHDYVSPHPKLRNNQKQFEVQHTHFKINQQKLLVVVASAK